jgi:hypothetical protein
MYRQGDVLLVPCDRIPQQVKPVRRDRGRVVLAYGEVTGHAHAFNSKFVHLFAGDGNRRYLRVESPIAELRHEEHAPISVPQGDYRVMEQREHSEHDEQRVAD